jgi:hypothetical protein
MNRPTVYRPTYAKSWALVIGINNYQCVSPLEYARQDAEGFAETLRSSFMFPPENVVVLLDGDATRDRILTSFLRLAEDGVSTDDRVVVFFAGHGHTRTGQRGEVGYLVPVGGNPNDLSTLVRWDDLTKNADLIKAKHMLFLMDACYGGLALKRSIPPGSARFIKDMLQRYSRQVLTAGKPDEPVADSGGPRAGHSMFTGHLLDALEGKAADSTGIISANAVMSYVYEHVSKDRYSNQCPHFGFFEGDGDLIFSPLPDGLDTEKTESDMLVQAPAALVPINETSDEGSLIDQVKDYLSDPRYRIRLDDLVSNEIRMTLHALRDEEFPLQTATVTPDDFADRIHRYEAGLSRLTTIVILLGRWGAEEHQPLIERVIARMADRIESRGGKVVWMGLRWYPIMLLMYSGGIAALSSRNYASLSTLLLTKLGRRITGQEAQEAVVATIDGMLEVEQFELFKKLPGHENQYTPRSEYLFKTLQPGVEDLLFLGNSYEELFDRFEILYALACADVRAQKGRNPWGPPGRFGWKGQFDVSASPFASLVDEAAHLGATWGPVTLGMFGGSIDRFSSVAKTYNEFLSRLAWY